jgi:hypothetical protein
MTVVFVSSNSSSICSSAGALSAPRPLALLLLADKAMLLGGGPPELISLLNARANLASLFCVLVLLRPIPKGLNPKGCFLDNLFNRFFALFPASGVYWSIAICIFSTAT